VFPCSLIYSVTLINPEKKTHRDYFSSISRPEAICQSNQQLIRRGAGWLQDNLHDSDDVHMMPGSCLCKWGETGHNRAGDVTGEWHKARIRIHSHVCRGEKGRHVLATSSLMLQHARHEHQNCCSVCLRETSLMCTIASCQKLPHEPKNTGSFRSFGNRQTHTGKKWFFQATVLL
jgi:hypothetical protein